MRFITFRYQTEKYLLHEVQQAYCTTNFSRDRRLTPWNYFIKSSGLYT